MNLIPGSYTVGASLQGFQPKTFRNYVLQVSQRARLDITLAVGGLEQAIDVTAVAPLLQTGNATMGQVINFRSRECAATERQEFRPTGDPWHPWRERARLRPAKHDQLQKQRRDELRPGGILRTFRRTAQPPCSKQMLIDGIDRRR